MKYKESIVIPCKRPDFPEGLGLRFASDHLINVETFLKENPEEVKNLLNRFQLLIFDEASRFTSVERIQDQFFPMHVDDPLYHPQPCRRNEPYVTALQLVNSKRTDPTHFAALSDYAGALRTWKSSFSRNSVVLTDSALVHSFVARHKRIVQGTIASEKRLLDSQRRAKWAYDQSALKYAHSWGKDPNSVVLYWSGALVDPKLVHGRLDVTQECTPAAHLFGMGGISESGLGGTRLFLP